MIDEQQLVLYYYADGLSAKERLQIRNALATDRELAQRYATVRAQLERLSVQPAAAVDPAVVQGWHDQLEAAARAEYATSVTRAPARGWSWKPWALAASVTMAVGLASMLLLRGASPPEQPVATVLPPTPPPFQRALQAHFADSRLTLAALPDATAQTRTELIDGIVAQNRLYAATAQQRGEERIARVLRAFEPVLLRMASEQTTDIDAASLRAQLTFEMDAMLTKVSRDASDISKSF